MTNSVRDKPMDVFNTVAEIKAASGRRGGDPRRAFGFVDLGTGSTDNGTGSDGRAEAARTLAKLNLKPKRTIRFVLFTGEEEGLVGSAKYAESHRDELEKTLGRAGSRIPARPRARRWLHDNYQDREIVDECWRR